MYLRDKNRWVGWRRSLVHRGRMESIIETPPSKISRRAALGKIAIATAGGLVWGGCGKGASSVQRSNKIRVGMVGLTCEAPLVAAVENGFFKEEGLEPEF